MLLNPYLLPCVGLVLLVAWAALSVWRMHTYWRRRRVPTLADRTYARILLDALLGRTGYGEFAHSFYRQFRRAGHRYGGFYGVLHPVLLVVDPELVRRVLTREFRHFHDRGMYHNEDFEPFSANLVTLEGARWRRTRTVFSPLFTATRMRTTFSVFDASSREMRAHLLDAARTSRPLDICHLAERLAIDNVGRAFFGLELDCLANPNKQFMGMGDFLSKCSFYEFMMYSFAGDYPNIIRLFGKRFIKSGTTKFFMEVVKQIFDYRRENRIFRNDFMDLFIERKDAGGDAPDAGGKYDRSLTFKEFAAECLGFYLGGYETSAATISFCLIELCLNQEIQDRLRDEITDTLTRHKELTYDAIVEMTYMDKVVKETLRKYPSIPILHRRCGSAWTLPADDSGDGAVLEPGVEVWVSVLGLHMDAAHWPHPHRFDPERFSEGAAPHPPFAYLPFGEGPRACIGQRFALVQVKTALAHALTGLRYTLHPGADTPLRLGTRGVFLVPRDKVLLHAEQVSS